jgi:predicted ATPase/DNA-binding SARP family transcriptional activator
MTSAPVLEIRLLGHLALDWDGRPQPLAALPRVTPLLAYLLLYRDRVVQRGYLANLLWPDVPEAEARANLRRHLHALRQALPVPPDGLPWVRAEGSGLRWRPDGPWWLDVAAFERLGSMPEGAAEAAELYRGDLLPDQYDDWLNAERERLRDLHQANLARLAETLSARGDLASAVAVARRAAAEDPLREDLQRQLMRLQHAAGDRSGAIETYGALAARLREELDISPAPETEALRLSILHEPASPAPPSAADAVEPLARNGRPEEPATTGPMTPPNNLPAPLTSLVGRAEALDWLAASLTAGPEPTRLLTLTGPGGVGKTRLALELATRLRDRQPAAFPGGLYLVALSGVSDPELVVPAIADALGDLPGPDGDPVTEVVTRLARQPTLLVLDNFEQVLPAASDVAPLLAAVPTLAVVVTSRARLGVYGEQIFEVPRLTLHSGNSEPHGPDADSDAVRLFVSRAKAVQASFEPSAEDLAAVATLCERHDGLPLAIEILAAHTRIFGPRELLARVEATGPTLASPNRDVPARHRSLGEAVAWSLDLLPPAEQALFGRLSVFAGAFTLAAATTVGGQDAASPQAIATLVDHSLLVSEPPRPGGTARRFRMLRTLRDVALRRLAEQGEVEAARRRHAAFFRTRAADERAFPILAYEHDDLRAALAWYLEDPAGAADGLRLAVDLWRFWSACGYVRQGRRQLDRALARAGDEVPPALRALALNAAGALASQANDLDAAEAYVQASLDLVRGGDDRLALIRGLNNLAGVRRELGAYAEAYRLSSECVAALRELGDLHRLVIGLANQADIATALQDYDRATAHLDEALALVEALGEPELGITPLRNLSIVLWLQGDLDRSLALIRQMRQLAEAHGDHWSLAFALFHEGLVHSDGANPAEAPPVLLEALRRFDATDEVYHVGVTLRAVGHSHLRLGDPSRCLRYHGAAAALLAENPSRPLPHEVDLVSADLSAAYAALGEPAAEAALSAGRALSRAAVVAELLDGPQSSPSTAPEPVEYGARWPT